VSVNRKTAVSEHRARNIRCGLVRVEVTVAQGDAELVRNVAAALSDPARQSAARTLLRGQFTNTSARGLKALLASAPREGVDLDRQLDAG
jgi:hypothetical protein